MALATCELVWINNSFKSCIFVKLSKRTYDNWKILHIDTNLVFHERTKHMGIDHHFLGRGRCPRNLVLNSLSPQLACSQI